MAKERTFNPKNMVKIEIVESNHIEKGEIVEVHELLAEKLVKKGKAKYPGTPDAEPGKDSKKDK